MCIIEAQAAVAANVAQAIAVPLALVALAYNGRQLRLTRRIEEGRFMLELERMSEKHDRVQALLRFGGQWHAGAGGPETIEDWCAIEDYMGFFEHCELLMKAGTLNPESFRKLFVYRIENIALHPIIVEEKLRKEPEHTYWSEFFDIVRRFEVQLCASVPDGTLRTASDAENASRDA